ncbi:DUF1127 domain-containing protein [Reyranella sp. MMS21-HV4-11]|uniref:DUF1127 domain-containing protein n=1 Tax=Reyranella humidisoli TaxID=2849149 RepID=A0ABS6IID5_9HYPH|nr:DUF1127 domain-containing protein [Reyranella sp. MMS21-HV4-11]MBU8874364.1 DUF1127 domain-containing protein [Reyranella sp. MMS21-HV4-11]
MSHLRRDLFPVDPFSDDPTFQSVSLPRLPLHRRLLAKLRLWRERARTRKALAQVDERSLRDAGIAPAQAAFEANQPFWRRLGRLR